MNEEKVTEDEKRAMVQGMLVLHNTIAVELSKQEVDPSHLLRLIATGMNQTILALAYLLSTDDGSVSLQDDSSVDDSKQMKLFEEDE